jgi:hypothetical protein
MPLPSLLPAPLSSFRARLRRDAPLGSIRRAAEFAFESTAHLVTLRTWMASLGRSSRIAAAMLAFAGIAFVSASGALAQNCKVEAPQMCSHWHWEETNGGIPQHLDCPGGFLTCLPIIKGDMKVNGYKLQAWGWHTLANSFPSPGSIKVFVPNGCACDVGGLDCVCLYPLVGMTIPCPNLANPDSGFGDCRP